MQLLHTNHNVGNPIHSQAYINIEITHNDPNSSQDLNNICLYLKESYSQRFNL
jgi:hypothetical protein